MAKQVEGQLRAEGFSFGLVVGRMNKVITGRLLDGALDCLRRHGAQEERIEIVWVPGAFEIPYATKRMAAGGKYQALICLGAVIRGETPHFNFVATEVAKGVAKVSLDTGVPAVFGVVTADTLEQALERAGAKAGNRGWDAALSAIEMVNLFSIL